MDWSLAGDEVLGSCPFCMVVVKAMIGPVVSDCCCAPLLELETPICSECGEHCSELEDPDGDGE
jgi:hypothetical protein